MTFYTFFLNQLKVAKITNLPTYLISISNDYHVFCKIELLFQMVQLIASGQISLIGVNALNPVKEASKTEKDQFCYCPEMEAEPVVEILEKKENAMIINVHVGFKKISKRYRAIVPTGFSSCLLFFFIFFSYFAKFYKSHVILRWSVLKLFDSFFKSKKNILVRLKFNIFFFKNCQLNFNNAYPK